MVQSRKPRAQRPHAGLAATCGVRAKPIEQLMKEQGIADEPPDYVKLFSAVWPAKKDAAEFRRFVRSIRRPSRD